MIRRTGIKRSAIKRKAKPTKRKKSELVLFKKKLWKKVSAYVKKRDGSICFVCGKTPLVGADWHAAHLFSAGKYNALRWTLETIRSGCYRCNVGLHGNYIEYRQKFIDTFGEAAYTELYNRRNDKVQWRLPDLQEIERQVDELEKQP